VLQRRADIAQLELCQTTVWQSSSQCLLAKQQIIAALPSITIVVVMVGLVGQNGMDYDCIPGQQQNEAEQDFINLYNHGSSRFIDKKMPECTGIFIGTV